MPTTKTASFEFRIHSKRAKVFLITAWDKKNVGSKLKKCAQTMADAADKWTEGKNKETGQLFKQLVMGSLYTSI